MLATKIDRASKTNMEKSERRNDEKACLPECQGEPEADGRGGVGGDGESCGTTEMFSDSLPHEDCEGKKVAAGQPDVALVCGGKSLEVRKTELGLSREVSTR